MHWDWDSWEKIEKWEWDFNLSNTGWDCGIWGGIWKNNFLGNGIRTPPPLHDPLTRSCKVYVIAIFIIALIIFFFAPWTMWRVPWSLGKFCDAYYAPINVKFDVKFPTPRQKCEVKYNWNSPPQEMICGQKFKYPYSRDSKIIQMPYPRAKAIDQIPALCPVSSPAGLTLIGA